MDDIESQEISCETEAGGSCSDASTSPELQGESKVLSPDGETPPVPVASSSPLPGPPEQPLQDKETEEILAQDTVHVSPVPGAASQAEPLTPTAPSKGQVQQEGDNPGKETVSKSLQFATKLAPTKKRVSSSKKAGLVFSVARINKRLKAGRYARRVGLTASVYMASVLEYLAAEVLELAGNCARYFKKQRVFPRCIQLTLLHDKELYQLTRGAIVPQGGVKPFIHPVLMSGKSEEQQAASEPPTAHTREDWYGEALA